MSNRDALEAVLQRAGADGRIRIAERPVLVRLVLEEIGIDGPGHDARCASALLDRSHVAEPARQIPVHVQCDRRAGLSQLMHESRVCEFLGQRDRGRRLTEDTEPRAGVGKSPRRQLDAKTVESRRDAVREGVAHERLRLSQEGFGKAAINGDDMAGRARARVARKPENRIGAVRRQDGTAGQRPACIELRQLGSQRLGRLII